VKRDEWLFLGRLVLVGFLFPLVWALVLPIAIELWQCNSRANQPVNPRLAPALIVG